MATQAQEKILGALTTATNQKSIRLEIPSNPNHGDYSTNIALISAKNLKKTPLEYANHVKSLLSKDKELNQIISKIEVIAPGFVNFHLSNNYLFSVLEEILSAPDYGSSTHGKGKTVIIEYSSPNIGKKFSIGHFRATVVGQALYNLHKFSGFTTIGENHLGDWGTQFGMIIAQVVRKNLDINSLSLEELERLYISFNKELEDNPELKEEAKQWFKKLEAGDKQARGIWEKAREISLIEFDKTYSLLGVSIDNAHGESFYEDKLPDIINESQNISKTGKNGAKIIEFGNMPPGMLQKSDGTTTYFTRDLAAIKYRLVTWHPDKIIYEVGSEQKLHFNQVFTAAKMIMPKAKEVEFVHIPHGLIRFAESKMSTRKGTNINLEEVLKIAVDKATELGSSGEAAIAVGIGALKYFDLMHNPTSEIIFDWDKVFVMEGNSGPYLQYTYARAQSVIAKSSTSHSPDSIGGIYTKNNLKFEELALLRTFPQFPGIISIATKNYSPNVLAEYLFKLAQAYNSFYNSNKIINSDNENFRLALTKATGNILKTGLKLLGIDAPEKM